MADGEGVDFEIYFYAMHNFGWKPSDWTNFSNREKALVIHGIRRELEAQERERKKAESQARAKRRR